MSTKLALDEEGEVIGYQFVHLGKMMEAIRKGMEPNEAYEKNVGTYGRFDEAAKLHRPEKAVTRRARQMAYFEGYERRIDKINGVIAQYGFKDLDEVKAYTLEKGVDAESIVRGIQPIAFENACWAYTLGAAIAMKKGCVKAADAAEAIGIGLQAFCIPGSVADQRNVGQGHGNLAAMLLREETQMLLLPRGS